MKYTSFPIVKASLVLSSKDLSISSIPNELISMASSLRPVDSYPIQSQKAGVAENSWVYTVKLDNCLCIQNAFNLLCTRCIDSHEKLLMECCNIGWIFTIVITIHMISGSHPEMVLDADALQVITKYKSSLSIDLYNYEEGNIAEA